MTVATTTLIEMDAEGHLTLPEEDAWAYTPEHLQRVARARQEFREGKAFELSQADLERIIEEADRVGE